MWKEKKPWEVIAKYVQFLITNSSSVRSLTASGARWVWKMCETLHVTVEGMNCQVSQLELDQKTF